MPELPEVETIRRGLKKYLVGHKVLSVEIRFRKTLKEGEEYLVGTKITNIRRFSKVLVIDFDNQYSALIHLKLTGQTIYRGPNLKNPPQLSEKIIGGLPGKHTHVIFHLDKGGEFYFNDYRKFGWIRILKTEDVETTGFIEKLGPEPFNGLTEKIFREIVSKVKTPIKLLLMNQEKIGGIGNIYANDALWLAKINPKRSSNSLTSIEITELFKAIISVLKKSLEEGGASDNAYVTSDGTEGTYQKYFLVYNRRWELCSRCKKAKIEKIKLGGRGTFFCPVCQK
jgi:formamidopyrimidine-DNA glycosylase